VLLNFRRDLAAFAASWWGPLASGGRHSDAASRMGWPILVGTLPIAPLGLAHAPRARGRE
jgi:undecaprenyl-diphosphatase